MIRDGDLIVCRKIFLRPREIAIPRAQRGIRDRETRLPAEADDAARALQVTRRHLRHRIAADFQPIGLQDQESLYPVAKDGVMHRPPRLRWRESYRGTRCYGLQVVKALAVKVVHTHGAPVHADLHHPRSHGSAGFFDAIAKERDRAPQAGFRGGIETELQRRGQAGKLSAQHGSLVQAAFPRTILSPPAIHGDGLPAIAGVCAAAKHRRVLIGNGHLRHLGAVDLQLRSLVDS